MGFRKGDGVITEEIEQAPVTVTYTRDELVEKLDAANAAKEQKLLEAAGCDQEIERFTQLLKEFDR